MYISEILEIANYRNLTGKTIKFNEKLNFLIGENNIGKTNILELINIFLAVGKFGEAKEVDFRKTSGSGKVLNYSEWGRKTVRG